MENDDSTESSAELPLGNAQDDDANDNLAERNSNHGGEEEGKNQDTSSSEEDNEPSLPSESQQTVDPEAKVYTPPSHRYATLEHKVSCHNANAALVEHPAIVPRAQSSQVDHER